MKDGRVTAAHRDAAVRLAGYIEAVMDRTQRESRSVARDGFNRANNKLGSLGPAGSSLAARLLAVVKWVESVSQYEEDLMPRREK